MDRFCSFCRSSIADDEFALCVGLFGQHWLCRGCESEISPDEIVAELEAAGRSFCFADVVGDFDHTGGNCWAYRIGFQHEGRRWYFMVTGEDVMTLESHLDALGDFGDGVSVGVYLDEYPDDCEPVLFGYFEGAPDSVGDITRAVRSLLVRFVNGERGGL